MEDAQLPPSPPPQRRSPAEAFEELTASVNRSVADISDLWDFSQKVKDKLLQATEIHRMEGMLPMLESMVLVHETLFRRLASHAKTGAKPSEDPNDDTHFIAKLLVTVEEELHRHGIEVIKPKVGSVFDPHSMDCSNKVALKDKGGMLKLGKPKPGTVASTSRCGFLYLPPSGAEARLVARAQVQVFAS